MEKVICVIGPTSAGKSDLAVAIAKKIGGEVISADSRQVYKGLNLGSGKITKKEMRGIPHHLLDVSSPKRIYTAASYKKDAGATIKGILAKGKTPIICGGTGLYVDTILGKVSIPEVPPNQKLRAQLASISTAKLFLILKKLDPRRASEIDKQNPVRLIRAIEIAKAIGRVPEIKKTNIPFDTLIIGLTLPQEELSKRIHLRLRKRFKAGMLKEAKKLHENGLSWRRMENLGLEYRYMARRLQGKISNDEMLHELEKEIIHYSKRQMRWFKRDTSIVWLRPTETKKAISLSLEFVKTH